MKAQKSEINTTPAAIYHKFWRGFEMHRWKNDIITAKKVRLQLKVNNGTFLTLSGHTAEKEMPQNISYPLPCSAVWRDETHPE